MKRKKQERKIARVTLEIDVPFWEYPTAKLNRRALAEIKRWIRNRVHTYIPMRVEKGSISWIEDATELTKVRTTKVVYPAK